jgi:AraC-like DNA-binding protein
MSYRNYVRCFKEVTGVTPMQFIVDQRIRYACEFLMKGYRVKEVAEKLHYSDLYFFSKQFKQQKGQSPKSWLKQDKLDF